MLVNKQTINLLGKEPETTGNKTNTPRSRIWLVVTNFTLFLHFSHFLLIWAIYQLSSTISTF